MHYVFVYCHICIMEMYLGTREVEEMESKMFPDKGSGVTLLVLDSIKWRLHLG